MKLTLSTNKLKEMVARSVKGAGNNKLLPITSLMAIELKNGTLTLITTDATNYLYIKEEHIVGEDFSVTVPVDLFSKLIAKMTCDNVVLDFNASVGVLSVKGNGNYKIDLPVDEDGQLIKYPNPLSTIRESNEAVEYVLNRSTVQVILETVKPALASTIEEPCYTGYYVGDKVVATDTYKIASMNIPIFDEAKLVSAELMDLLSVMLEEKITTTVYDNIVVFSTKDCVIYGAFMENIEDYAIDAISDLIESDFTSMCKVPKSSLLQLLDRLSLFVGPYDKNGINLTFTNNGLQVSSKASNGVELIEYVGSENFQSFTCDIDIEMLKQEVKAIQSDVLELYYGLDNGIKLVDGNITIIVALLENSDVSDDELPFE